MPLKGHRSNSTGRLGRTSSATKITNNLHFTQKDLPVSKHTDKQKKTTGYAHEKAPAFGRTNSSQRIQPREQMQPLKRVNQPSKFASGKPKAGFTISSPTEEDDDEWVSSSSGVATPNQNDSDSETASDNDGFDTDPLYAHVSQPLPDHDPSFTLQRVDTARPLEFSPSTPQNASHLIALQSPNIPSQLQALPRDSDILHVEVSHLESQPEPEMAKEIGHVQLAQRSPRIPHTKRSSRPSSTYSFSGKPDVRPHPLIRGQSFGHVNVVKPSPLAPLTAAAPPQLSTSPTGSLHEDPRNFLPSSPASTSASSFNDRSISDQKRRSSISSARSTATVPQPMFRPEPSRAYDRTRTLSTMSNSSSSAALSALSHLPAVTRPPSPQSVVFFPPINPHANTENIHPLLPGPYLNNHLTVLSRRIPLRESYDRVIRAKQALAA